MRLDELPPRENFLDWYNEIVEKAGLTDKRYPIKGMNVWTPYGWKIMQSIDSLIREEFDSTGHDEVNFPTLIPETEFAKEAEHIKGFGKDVYWVTHAGENELDVKLLLRPTSETAMYPMFSLWIRSHSDLPLKIYQIVSTFRYETKQTRAFIRVREIHFFEAHTAHRDYEDAERQIREDLDILDRLMKKLCIPYMVHRRPDWDKFAGAYYSLGIDTLMEGKILQIGSIHQYKDNFAIPYDIQYEDEKGEHHYVHQTTFGMSERLLGAIIGIHGDDHGLILPPAIAPYQVVIVPIPKKGHQEDVYKACRELEDMLKKEGFRVHFDDRDIRPGNKYYQWEIKGVPVRIELGMKDMENNSVMLFRRDTMEKESVPVNSLVQKIRDTLKDIERNLYERAAERMKGRITEIEDFSDFDKDNAPDIVKTMWCGNDKCGQKLEEITDMNVLGTDEPEEHATGKCPICGKGAEKYIYLARTY